MPPTWNLYQFVWLPSFETMASRWLDDDARRALEDEIAADPERSPTVSGAGGVRKIRVPLPGRGKGKRGGARAIYYYRASRGRIYMIAFYTKGDAADLTPADRRVIGKLTKALEQEE